MITVTRRGDKVVLETHVFLESFDAEEALKLANDIIEQADKILAATAKE